MREEIFGKEHGLKRHKHIGVVKEVGRGASKTMVQTHRMVLYRKYLSLVSTWLIRRKPIVELNINAHATHVNNPSFLLDLVMNDVHEKFD